MWKKLWAQISNIKERNLITMVPTLVGFVVLVASMYNYNINAADLTLNIDNIIHNVFIIVGAIASIYGIIARHIKIHDTITPKTTVQDPNKANVTTPEKTN